MKKDIRNRKDIEKIVNCFYTLVKKDDTIGYLFTDIAQVNWELHLPKMYDFWENILFYTANYTGSPMQAHKDLHQKSALNESHFKRWSELFVATVDRYFEGEKAEEIKNRALNIASAIMYKTIY